MNNSILVKKQFRTFKKEGFRVEGGHGELVVKVRYDDRSGNGHNTFSITGTIYRDGLDLCGGCIHDEISEQMPELAHLIKWHLMSSDEPMHYLSNTMYIASARDCNGLLKGEFKQIATGGDINRLNWETAIKVGNDVRTVKIKGINSVIQSPTEPACDIDGVFYIPWGRVGEGKEPDLDGARRSAIWHDATLEQLQNKELLQSRLPALIAEFKAVVESLGMVY